MQREKGPAARGTVDRLWRVPGYAARPAACQCWVPVLERHPEGVVRLPGYVWLDTPGKVRSVAAHELEFREDETSGSQG
jgi:hypothetical protein